MMFSKPFFGHRFLSIFGGFGHFSILVIPSEIGDFQFADFLGQTFGCSILVTLLEIDIFQSEDFILIRPIYQLTNLPVVDFCQFYSFVKFGSLNELLNSTNILNLNG